MSAAPVIASKIKVSLTNILSGENFVFDKGMITVGRGPENDIVISNDAKMSREHAQIRQQSGQLFIKNLSQKNFILVNGLPVEDYLLEPGAQIQIGETVFHIHFDKPIMPQNLNPNLNLSLVTNDNANNANNANNAIATQNLSVKPKEPARKSVSIPKSNQSLNGIPANNGLYAPNNNASNAFNSGVNHHPLNAAAYGASVANANKANNKIIFGAIILIVIVGFFFFSENAKKNNTAATITMEQDRIKAIDDTTKLITKLEEEKSKKNENTVQYKAAHEHYLKGLRDYYNGQYSRAMVSFQSALSIYPDHNLSRRYWTIAKSKFDEQVDIHMRLGKRYLGQNNYRLCMSEFRTVLTMVKDQSDLKYKESKSYYDQCRVSMETGN